VVVGGVADFAGGVAGAPASTGAAFFLQAGSATRLEQSRAATIKRMRGISILRSEERE
jgi:hypothetical protein